MSIIASPRARYPDVRHGVEVVHSPRCVPSAGPLHPFSLDRMMDRPQEHPRPGLALDQVVLGAFANGLNAHGLVFQAGQDNDGQVGRRGVGPLQRGYAHAVRQPQIEQDGIDLSSLLQIFRGLLQTFDVRDLQLLVNQSQRLSQQIRIARIVFHQQDMEDRLRSWSVFLAGSRRFSLGQFHDGQPELLDRLDDVHELLEIHRLGDVTVGMQLIGAKNVFFGL